MERDVVTFAKDLVPLLHQLDVLRQALFFGEGVVGQHRHIEAQGGLSGNQPADVAQAQQAQGLAIQFRLGDAHFGLAVVLQVQLLHLLEVPGAVEHIEDGQLGHRNGVGPAGGAHQHAMLPCRIQVYTIIARTVPGQDLQLGGCVQNLLCDLRRSDDDRIAVSDVRDDVLLSKAAAIHHLVAVLPQIFIASRQNGLGKQHSDRHKNSSSLVLYTFHKIICVSFEIMVIWTRAKIKQRFFHFSTKKFCGWTGGVLWISSVSTIFRSCQRT